jgi:hypothetical protein
MKLVRRYRVAREIAIERLADRFTEGLFFTKWIFDVLPEWVYLVLLLFSLLGGITLLSIGLFRDLPTVFGRFVIPVWQELHR